MKYKGLLYGKVSGRYIPIESTASDVDDMYDRAAAALKEWDILPSDRPYKIEEVTDWLVRFMAPAMEDLRAAIVKATTP